MCTWLSQLGCPRCWNYKLPRQTKDSWTPSQTHCHNWLHSQGHLEFKDLHTCYIRTVYKQLCIYYITYIIIHLSSHFINCTSFQVHCLLYVVIWRFAGIAGHCWALLGSGKIGALIPLTICRRHWAFQTMRGWWRLDKRRLPSASDILHAYYAPARFNGSANICKQQCNSLCWCLHRIS